MSLLLSIIISGIFGPSNPTSKVDVTNLLDLLLKAVLEHPQHSLLAQVSSAELMPIRPTGPCLVSLRFHGCNLQVQPISCQEEQKRINGR